MDVPDEVIERFLATGRLARSWPDWEGTPAARRKAAETRVRHILGRIVRWRAQKAPIDVGTPPPNAEAVVRERARPMVEGLFSAVEAPAVLECLPACVVVLTPASYPELIRSLPPRTAWDLANLLLDAMGAPPLSDDTPELDGMSHDTSGYVLPSAFAPAEASDVLVHEIAHLLHSLPRKRAGVAPPDAPLLSVKPTQRETFAWACEAWSLLSRRPDPVNAVERWCTGEPPADVRVNREQLTTALRSAAAGAGWAAIRSLTD